VTIQPELAPYLDELVERIGGVVDLEAAYVVGSGATGTFDPYRSDVDVVVVVPRSLSDDEKRAIVEAAEGVHPPGRKLELVVYARGSSRYELNLNTGELVSFDAAGDQEFWFVLDRAAAEQHAVPLAGPPWDEVFEPVEREEVLDALAASLDWHEAEEPLTASSVLNTSRAWQWLETGAWVSKPETARWLRSRVRDAIEAAR
jgi:predicted nucleotidyltransferase